MREIRPKIIAREKVAERLGKAAREGRSLALANGCFDVLHVGHVRYLKAAKEEADILLVAINDDASIKALKGPGRPVQTDDDRAEVVAALACVDFVTVFPELTVEALIFEVEPDVQCKGTDYTEQSVPEREAIVSRGGRVAIVGDTKSHDSSAILKRAKDSGE